jgi:predicted acylesterase/phospholipase RssA
MTGEGTSNSDSAKRELVNKDNRIESASKPAGARLPEVFADVFPVELDEISKRRRIVALNRGKDESGNLVGLALSGGGIRSATFCLGLLQGLKSAGLLRIFDYLSTVSGGGYVGGWWSAWLARPSLGVQDLKNPASFVAKLRNNSDTSLSLRERLTPKVLALLSNHNEDDEPSDLLVNEVLFELSDLLCRADFFDDRWMDVVSEETKRLFEEAKNKGQFFWANRALLSDAYPGEIISGLFPPHEGIEPRRARYQQMTDLEETDERNGKPRATRETASAWADPIHHLRLYANYLTPRRGLLSSDTWRAVAVATRNITMSWLVLLPMLVAVVLAGQLYFVFQDNPVGTFIKPSHDTNQRLSAREQRFALAEAKERLSVSEASSATLDSEPSLSYEAKLEDARIQVESELIKRRNDALRIRALQVVAARAEEGNDSAKLYLDWKARADNKQDQEAIDYIDLHSVAGLSNQRELSLRDGLIQQSDKGDSEAQRILKALSLRDNLIQRSDKGDPDARRILKAGFLTFEIEEQLVARDAQVARAWFAAKPLVAIAGWIALMGLAWLYFTVETNHTRDRVIAIAGTLVVAAVIITAITFLGEWHAVRDWWEDGVAWHFTWLIMGVLLLAFALRRPGGFLNLKFVVWGLMLIGVSSVILAVSDSSFLPWILGNIRLVLTVSIAVGAALVYAQRRRAKARRLASASLPGSRPGEAEEQIHDLWRNQITLVHARLLAALVLVAIVLFISGFGHEMVTVLSINEGWKIPRELGPWVALIASVFGSLFTVFKVKPRGGEDKRQTSEPNVVSRAIFALTPPLVVLVLAVLAAWAGHALLAMIEDNRQTVNYLSYLIAVSAPLYFMLAVFEMGFPTALSNIRKIAMLSWLIVPAVWVGHTLFRSVGYNSSASQIGLSIVTAVFILGMALLFTSLRKHRGSDTSTKERIMDWATVASFLVVSVVCDFGAADHQYSPTEPGRASLLDLVGVYLGTRKFQHVWLVILPLLIALLVGGLVLYRWMVTEVEDEESKTPRRAFKLARFKQLAAENRIVAGWPNDKRKSWREVRRRDLLWLLGAACIVLAFAASCFSYDLIAEAIGTPSSHSHLSYIGLTLCGAALSVTLFFFRKARLALQAVEPGGQANAETQPAVDRVKTAQSSAQTSGRAKKLLTYMTHPRVIVAMMPVFWLALAVPVAMLVVRTLRFSRAFEPEDRIATSVALAAIVLCFTYIRFEMRLSKGNNRRWLFLITCAYITLLDLLFISFVPKLETHPNILYAHAVIGLMATALAWVVGLGWMADPNAFSMHAFYKARLARAYIGASNIRRSRQRKQITEPSTDDDLPLKDLRNADKGAPYHLINTTLNLVAARDLATAQRSAASFVLSQRYCGSARTGYRNTPEFMGGRLTLGTAVAISGAAASPNMGTRTPSATLAMLMTLLNVRLGYWVPTPDKPFWHYPQTRLWPFYLANEFLSHTNELSDYCYLTDGGHFDNTGLYSLIERGCKYVVVADCGADPKSSFSDMGEVIRRCRIDFGAEINIDLSQFIDDEEVEPRRKRKRPRLPFVVGSIKYSAEHLAQLRKAEGTHRVKPGREKRDGVIILFKPSITASKPADVTQYELDNPVFPQQSTTNQWFGEAQFESYRRLGEYCAQRAFQKLKYESPDSRRFVSSLFRAVEDRFKAETAKQKASPLKTVSSIESAASD